MLAAVVQVTLGSACMLMSCLVGSHISLLLLLTLRVTYIFSIIDSVVYKL